MISMKYFIASCFFFVFLLQTEAIGKIPIKLDEQTEHFEGDLELKRDRNGILAGQRWTNGKIPYEINEKFKGKEYTSALATAMKEIEDHTCIKFLPRTTEANYLTIFNGSGCFSDVGMTGGKQYLSLADSENGGSCWTQGTMVHEMLHAVGLWHEQSRYDRDQYIKINEENVAKGLLYNFAMKSAKETDTYGVPYNYLSVMHYAKTAFGKGGAITIETLDPWFQDLIGNRDNGNTGADSDYEKVRKIYNCPTANYPTMPPTTTMAPPPCQDTYEWCSSFLKDCAKLDSFTQTMCRKSCGLCSASCADKVSYCRDRGRQCKTDPWMKVNCAKSCKFCSLF